MTFSKTDNFVHDLLQFCKDHDIDIEDTTIFEFLAHYFIFYLDFEFLLD